MSKGTEMKAVSRVLRGFVAFALAATLVPAAALPAIALPEGNVAQHSEQQNENTNEQNIQPENGADAEKDLQDNAVSIDEKTSDASEYLSETLPLQKGVDIMKDSSSSSFASDHEEGSSNNTEATDTTGETSGSSEEAEETNEKEDEDTPETVKATLVLSEDSQPIGTVLSFGGLAYMTGEPEPDGSATVSWIGWSGAAPQGHLTIPAEVGVGKDLYTVTAVDVSDDARLRAERALDSNASSEARAAAFSEAVKAIGEAPLVEYIELPSTVREFEPASLAAYPNLRSISVEEGNEHLSSSNGMLFSVDGLKLMGIPSGLAGRVSIPSSVVEVSPMAFALAKGVTSIRAEAADITNSSTQTLPAIALTNNSTSKADVGKNDYSAYTENALITIQGLLYRVRGDGTLDLVAAPGAIGNVIELASGTVSLTEGSLWALPQLESIITTNEVSDIAVNETNLATVSTTLPIDTGGNESAKNVADASVRTTNLWVHIAAFAEGCAPVVYGPWTDAWEAAGAVQGEGDVSSAAGFVDIDGVRLEKASDGNGLSASLSPETRRMMLEINIPASAEIEGVTYPVTSIAAGGFQDARSLYVVNLPDSVSEIGVAAFAGCENLLTINLGAGIERIGAKAFEGTSLLSLEIPGSVRYIGANAFSGIREATFVVAKGVSGVEPTALGAATGVSIYAHINDIDMWRAALGLPVAANDAYVWACEAGSGSAEWKVGEACPALPEGGSLITEGTAESRWSYPAAVLSIDTETEDATALRPGSWAINVSVAVPIKKAVINKSQNHASLRTLGAIPESSQQSDEEASDSIENDVPGLIIEKKESEPASMGFTGCAVGRSAYTVGQKIVDENGIWQYTYLEDNTWSITCLKKDTIGTDTEGIVTIPGEFDAIPVTVLENYCLNDAKNIKELTVSENITTSAGRFTLRGLTSLEKVHFPSTLRDIVWGTDSEGTGFLSPGEANIAKLAYIDFPNGSDYYTVEDNTVIFSKDRSVLYHYACGRQGDTYIIPDTVTTLNPNGAVFNYNPYIKHIIFSDGIKSIYSTGFVTSGCTQLNSVTFGVSLESIEIAGEFFDNPPDFKSLYIKGMAPKKIKWGNKQQLNNLNIYMLSYTKETLTDDIKANLISNLYGASVDRIHAGYESLPETNVTEFTSGSISVRDAASEEVLGTTAASFMKLTARGIDYWMLMDAVDPLSLASNGVAYDYCVGEKMASLNPQGIKVMTNFSSLDRLTIFPANEFTLDLSIVANTATDGVWNYSKLSDNTWLIKAVNPGSMEGEVIIPASYAGRKVTVIGNACLNNAAKMTKLIIPEGVVKVDGQYAVRGCTSLQSITIPSTLTSITWGDGGSGSGFLSDANASTGALSEIIVSPDNPEFTTIDNVLYNKDVTRLYVYPNGKFKTGSTTEREKIFYVPDTVTDFTTTGFPFSYCPYLEHIVFPDKATEITGWNLETGCVNLKSLTFGASTTSVNFKNEIYDNVPSANRSWYVKGRLESISGALNQSSSNSSYNTWRVYQLAEITPQNVALYTAKGFKEANVLAGIDGLPSSDDNNPLPVDIAAGSISVHSNLQETPLGQTTPKFMKVTYGYTDAWTLLSEVDLQALVSPAACSGFFGGKVESFIPTPIAKDYEFPNKIERLTSFMTKDVVLTVTQTGATSEDDVWKYTMLDDGTWSIVAKNPASMTGEVVVPNMHKGIAVTVMGDRCLYQAAMSSLVISEGITKAVGGYCVRETPNLQSALLPATLVDINWGVDGTTGFLGQQLATGNLKTITIARDNPAFTCVDNVIYSKDMTTLLRYAPGKEDKTFVVPSTIRRIGGGAYAFVYNPYLQNIVFSDEIVRIDGTGLECGCDNLRTIVFGASMKYLNFSARIFDNAHRANMKFIVKGSMAYYPTISYGSADRQLPTDAKVYLLTNDSISDPALYTSMGFLEQNIFAGTEQLLADILDVEPNIVEIKQGSITVRDEHNNAQMAAANKPMVKVTYDGIDYWQSCGEIDLDSSIEEYVVKKEMTLLGCTGTRVQYLAGQILQDDYNYRGTIASASTFLTYQETLIARWETAVKLHEPKYIGSDGVVVQAADGEYKISSQLLTNSSQFRSTSNTSISYAPPSGFDTWPAYFQSVMGEAWTDDMKIWTRYYVPDETKADPSDVLPLVIFEGTSFEFPENALCGSSSYETMVWAETPASLYSNRGVSWTMRVLSDVIHLSFDAQGGSLSGELADGVDVAVNRNEAVRTGNPFQPSYLSIAGDLDLSKIDASKEGCELKNWYGSYPDGGGSSYTWPAGVNTTAGSWEKNNASINFCYYILNARWIEQTEIDALNDYTWTLNDDNCSYTLSISNENMSKFAGSIELPSKHPTSQYPVTVVDNIVSSSCNITSLTVPEGVKKLGQGAVCSIGANSTFRILNLPASLEEISFGTVYTEGPEAFVNGEPGLGYDCRAFNAINVASGNKKFSSKDGILYNRDFTRLLKVPPAWSQSDYVMPSSVTSVESRALRDMQYLQSVTFSDSIQEIDGLFVITNCPRLKTVTLGAELRRITGASFASGCPKLSDVYVNSRMLYKANGYTERADRTGWAWSSSTPRDKVVVHFIGDQTERAKVVWGPASVTKSFEIIGDNGTAQTVSITGADFNLELFDLVNNDEGLFDFYPLNEDDTLASSWEEAAHAGVQAHDRGTISGDIVVPGWHSEILANGLPKTFQVKTLLGDEKGFTNNGLFKGFFGSGQITSITLSEGITTIQNFALRGLTLCKEMNFPSSVTSISWGISRPGFTQEGCASQCPNLKKIKVSPQNPRYASDSDGICYEINQETGEWDRLCKVPQGSGVTRYVMPDTIKTIEMRAIHMNRTIEEVVFSDSIEIMDCSLFLYQCSRVHTLTFGSNLKAIQNAYHCFDGASAIRDIYVKGSLTNAGAGSDVDGDLPASWHVNVLKEARVHFLTDQSEMHQAVWGEGGTFTVKDPETGEDKEITVRGAGFNPANFDLSYGDNTLFKYVPLNADDTEAASWDVAHHAGIAPKSTSSVSGNVLIPATYSATLSDGTKKQFTVEVVLDFNNCNEITSLTFSEGIRRIKCGSQTLSKLKDVKIPATMEDINWGTQNLVGTNGDPGAFTYCGALEKFEVAEDSTVYASTSDGCIYGKKSGTDELETLYKIPRANGVYDFTVPEGVTKIWRRAIYEHNTVENIVFPNTLSVIDMTFCINSCPKLQSITFGTGFKNLTGGAFANNCGELRHIYVNSKVEFVAGLGYAQPSGGKPWGAAGGYTDKTEVHIADNVSSLDNVIAWQKAGFKIIHAEGITYTVTFNSLAGTPVESQVLGYDPVLQSVNQKAKRPDPAPTKEGFVFAGWYTDTQTWGKMWDFDSDLVTEEMTLYARWLDPENTYSYTINHKFPKVGNPNEYEVETITLSGNKGENVTASPLNRNGFSCADEEERFVLDSDGIEKTFTYTRNTYTITYNAGGVDDLGAAVSGKVNNADSFTTSTIEFEAPITSGLTAICNGFNHVGWWEHFAEDDADHQFVFGDASVMPARNLVLTAHYKPYIYNIVYSAGTDGSGTLPQNMAVRFNGTFDLQAPTSISKTGYTFVNKWIAAWTGKTESVEYAESQTDIPGATFVKDDGAAIVDGSTVTMTAKWEANTYTVHFDKGETAANNEAVGVGSVSGTMADESFTYGETKSLRKNAYTRNGYSFAGWAVADNRPTATLAPDAIPSQDYTDSVSVSNLSEAANGEVTLYAIWQRIGYTATVHHGGGAFTNAGGWTLNTNAKTYTMDYDVEHANISSPEIERGGYDFKGWASDSTSIVGDLTFTIVCATTYDNTEKWAVWDTHTNIITYKLDGGAFETAGSTDSSSYSATTYKVTDSDLTIQNPKKIGYTFTGWTEEGTHSGPQLGADATTKKTTIKAGTYGDITLVAGWQIAEFVLVYVAGSDKASLKSDDGYADNDYAKLKEVVKNQTNALSVEVSKNDANYSGMDIIKASYVNYKNDGSEPFADDKQRLIKGVDAFYRAGFMAQGWTIGSSDGEKLADEAPMWNYYDKLCSEDSPVVLYANWNATINITVPETVSLDFGIQNGISNDVSLPISSTNAVPMSLSVRTEVRDADEPTDRSKDLAAVWLFTPEGSNVSAGQLNCKYPVKIEYVVGSDDEVLASMPLFGWYNSSNEENPENVWADNFYIPLIKKTVDEDGNVVELDKLKADTEGVAKTLIDGRIKLVFDNDLNSTGYVPWQRDPDAWVTKWLGQDASQEDVSLINAASPLARLCWLVEVDES